MRAATRASAASRCRLGVGLAALVLALAASAPAAAATGLISTVAGTGQGGFAGDGGPATAALIDGPRGVAWMPDGGFLIADLINARVRRVWPDGRITTVAGTGVRGYEASDDGGPATSAELDFLHGVAVLPDGDIAIADTFNNRIRHVSMSTGTITTIAGTGEKGYRAADEGGPATGARIGDIRGIAATAAGILIADADSNIVRRVSPGGATGHDGTITTVAGTPPSDWLDSPLPPGAFAGDGGPATAASLDGPFGVGPTADGGFLIADAGNRRIRRVSPSGTITTVAGSGQEPSAGQNGDGGPALAATMFAPLAVVETPPGGFLPGGGFLIAENVGNRVRYVSPGGTITTAVGTGQPGSLGDGGPADTAQLNGPRGLAIRPDGRFLIAEFGPGNFTVPPIPAGGDRIRLVGPEPGSSSYPPPVPRVATTARAQLPRLLLRLARRLHARYGRAIRLRYSSTVAASVRVTIRKGRRRVATATRTARTGRNRITLHRRLRPGRYSLRLTARAAGGRVNSVRARLTVGPRRARASLL